MPSPLMGSRLAGASLGREERRAWCSKLQREYLEIHFSRKTNTHPLGNVMMSRAREILRLFSEGFLQHSCQVTPLFKSILQSEQAFSPTAHSSWRFLTTKQQCHTSTWLAVLLQHIFAPFSCKFLVSDGNIYMKNTRVYNTTNWRGGQRTKQNPKPTSQQAPGVWTPQHQQKKLFVT